MSVCPKCDDDKFYDLHCSRCGFDTVELLVTERDAARARVAELEREKDTDNLAWEHLLDLFKGAESERDAARAEVERLREALRSYGAHAPDCGDAHGCTCGYSAALAGKEKP